MPGACIPIQILKGLLTLCGGAVGKISWLALSKPTQPLEQSCFAVDESPWALEQQFVNMTEHLKPHFHIVLSPLCPGQVLTELLERAFTQKEAFTDYRLQGKKI